MSTPEIDLARWLDEEEKAERYPADDEIKKTGRLITTDVAFEAKTASYFTADQWRPSQELEILNNNVRTEHEIPLFYETQIQWYCGVLGLR